jgi:hypothetical protein
MLDPVHFGPIVDFVRHRKFGTENVLSEDGTVDRRPLDPTFTMKGRTPAALLRRVDEWHRELGKDSRVPDVTWEPSGLIHKEPRPRHGFGTPLDHPRADEPARTCRRRPSPSALRRHVR